MLLFLGCDLSGTITASIVLYTLVLLYTTVTVVLCVMVIILHSTIIALESLTLGMLLFAS